MCVKGDHEFPEEDDQGAYCTEHGAMLLFRGDPIAPEDLAHDYPGRPDRLALDPAAPEAPEGQP